MTSGHEAREQIQKILEPYVLPREEVSYRRRILALYLESCVGDGPLSSPLALVQPTQSIAIPAEARGLHREYLEALNANISARNEFAKVQKDLSHGSKPGAEGAGARTVSEPATLNPLDEHLVKIKLQRKQDKLRIVEKHIALLNQKPAAAADFLDPEEILKDTRPLPDVPREVVEGLALGETTGKADLEALIDRLERQVLRAKLLLKSEERLLDAVKGRSTLRPENITDDAKLIALNTTRTELISWMETELSKASGDESDGDGDNGHGEKQEAAMDSAQMDEQLASIRNKYAQYLAARKSLLQLVSQQPQPAMPPKIDSGAEQRPTTAPAPTPVAYLLTPYLERLLSLAREQKGLITQKSHLNITIAKQLKETVQMLDQLADESNLLPSHPVPGGAARRTAAVAAAAAGGFGDSLLTASETLDAASRVRPWVYAADSAKIATLEAVAEKIEEGQVALEGSMAALQEVARLLGRPHPGAAGAEDGGAERAASGGAATDDDIWLAEEDGRPTSGRRHARKPSKTGGGGADDLWAFLDGNLGLLKPNGE